MGPSEGHGPGWARENLAQGLVLAVDTSTREGSAAIAGAVGEEVGRLEVLARVTLRAEEEHASLLVPRVGALMDEVGADGEEISGVVVGAGPGSFTGVRVGAATAKGLARAWELPLWAFSSLAAAAVNDGMDEVSGPLPDGTYAFPGAFPESRPRCVLFDARGDRVYAAGYRIPRGGRGLETLLLPRAADMAEMLEERLPPDTFFMGDGALKHRNLLEKAGFSVLPPPFGRPTADGLIRLLSLSPETPPLPDPWRWEPEYLRASGAERMWKVRRGVEP